MSNNEKDKNYRPTFVKRSQAKDEETGFLQFSSGLRQLASFPVYFLDSLFRPVIVAASRDLSDIYTHQRTRITKEGGSNYIVALLKKGYQSVKDHPFNTASVALSLTFSLPSNTFSLPSNKDVSSIALIGSNVLIGLKHYKDWVQPIAGRIVGKTFAARGKRVLFYGGSLCILAILPIAEAQERAGFQDWNSLQAAKDYYAVSCYAEDNPLGPHWLKNMPPMINCLQDGGNTAYECCVKVKFPSLLTSATGTIFTEHPSPTNLNPISITYFDGATPEQVCFVTALSLNDVAVTKTCMNPVAGNLISVERISQSLELTHKGLEAGKSVDLIEVISSGSGVCAYFGNPYPARYPPKTEDTICVLTALESGGATSLMCVNPNNLAISLKPAERLSLDFGASNDDKSRAMVIRKPLALGLDVCPWVSDDSPSSQAPKESGTMCENGKCYKYEKVEVPCGRSEL